MKRLLVIRGGAIGDFILTLPALRVLRERYREARIEVLGYKHIAAIAHNRFYADDVRSIEYGPLSRFFAPGAEVEGELAEWFGSFDLILSYLYDPDRFFETNLRRCGVQNLLIGPGKIDLGSNAHAAAQLAAPLRKLGISDIELNPRVFPSVADRQFATEFLKDVTSPAIAMHPGSGSEKKNWPIDNWIGLGNALLSHSAPGSGGFPTADSPKPRSANRRALLVLGGEADREQLRILRREWAQRGVVFAENFPLPHIAALIERAGVFVGHDSGISHLAAGTGAKCVLLFGPSDPSIWAPAGPSVHVIRAGSQRMDGIAVKMVADAISSALSS